MNDLPPLPPPPPGPPPPPVVATPAIASPPPGGRGQRALIAALAAVALLGAGLVWMSFQGGAEEMREDTVSLPDDDEADGGNSSDDESDRGEQDTVATDTAAETTAVTTMPVETTIPPSTAPATVTLPETVPPTTATPATVPPSTLAPATAPPATSAPGVVFSGRCESVHYGWDVGIPEGWFEVEDPDGWWTCAGFERYPVTAEPDTELVVPITITFLENELATDVYASYSDGSFVDILTEASTTVDIYDAWRLETSATGDGYFENGTLAITYIVDRGGWSTVLIDGFGYTPAEYEEVKAIVDAMAGDIVFWDN